MCVYTHKCVCIYIHADIYVYYVYEHTFHCGTQAIDRGTLEVPEETEETIVRRLSFVTCLCLSAYVSNAALLLSVRPVADAWRRCRRAWGSKKLCSKTLDPGKLSFDV